SWMKRVTIACPMPEPPPVTSATCPSSQPVARSSSPALFTPFREPARLITSAPLNAGAASHLLPVPRLERVLGPAQPPEDSMGASASASRSQAGTRFVGKVSTYIVVF